MDLYIIPQHHATNQYKLNDFCYGTFSTQLIMLDNTSQASAYIDSYNETFQEVLMHYGQVHLKQDWVMLESLC